MSERVWSESQASAIGIRDVPTLVSAGAGSGKTSVLVQRVVDRVLGTDAVDLDQLLIVTFTEAAAQEMRSRIGQALQMAADAQPSNERPIRQLFLLERASISTLHSFCLQVLRLAGTHLPVDPGFRVASEQEMRMLRALVLDDALEEAFAGATDGFLEFVMRYGDQRGEIKLRSAILELDAFAQSQPDPVYWLEAANRRLQDDASKTLATTSFADSLFIYFSDLCEYALDLTVRALELCMGHDGPAGYTPALKQDQARLMQALQAAQGRDFTSLSALLALPFVTLPADRQSQPEMKKQVQDLRQKVKKAVQSLSGGLCARPEAELLAEMADTIPWMRAFTDLVMAFRHAYKEAKRQRGLVDFSDLEHFAYDALLTPSGGPSQLAIDLRAQFVEILVDEYQDTSPIQDALLSMVAVEHNANLFQVGDVKQSIYRFRMAEPSLFLQKYNRYGTSATIFDVDVHGAAAAIFVVGRRIDLQENYRSRSQIVNVVNDLFGQVFSPRLGGITYDERTRMKLGADYPVADEGLCIFDDPVELHLIDTRMEMVGNLDNERSAEDGSFDDATDDFVDDAVAPYDDDELDVDVAAIEMEARVMAERIRTLLAEKRVIYDTQTKAYRPLGYRDIAVLLRTRRGRMEPILRTLRDQGIACHGESDTGFYAGYEMRAILSLMAILDNPLQDIPLASVMRSCIGEFSSTDLAQMRSLGGLSGRLYESVVHTAAIQALTVEGSTEPTLSKRAQVFLQRLDEWRTYVRSHPTSDSLSWLYEQSGIIQFVTGLPAGEVRLANLDTLVRQARTHDELTDGDFYGFVQFLQDHRERGGDAGEANVSGENEDVVRVMTVHQAKGLEFPVVIVPDLGHAFRLTKGNSGIALHRVLGFGPEYVDLQHRERFSTAAFVALEQAELQESLAEEARILYVALTRAREHLILLGSAKDIAMKVEDWLLSTHYHRDNEEQTLPRSVLVRARSFLDWMIPAVFRHHANGSPLFHILWWNQGGVWNIPRKRVLPSAEVDDESVNWQAICRLTPDALPSSDASCDQDREQWRMQLQGFVQSELQREPLMDIPAKLTVTEWKRDWLAQVEAEDEAVRWDAPAVLRPFVITKPQFLQQEESLTSAQRGSLFHFIMQHIDLSSSCQEPDGVSNLLMQMRDRGQLSDAQILLVSVDEIAAFFRTPLGEQMVQYPDRVRREVPFTVGVPAEAIAALRGQVTLPYHQKQQVILQGIADCVILRPHDVVLIDYKTDHTDGHYEALVRSYEPQIALYQLALQRAYSKPVTEAYLYFVQGAKTVPVTKFIRSGSGEID